MKSVLQKVKSLTAGQSFSLANIDRRVLVFCHDVVALFAAMQLSMWLVLKDELQLLEPGFILKESVIFSLIASGFFLWFQTYKGIWRYVSWRQSALLVGVLGFSSLIFFPLLTKAHMQPIAIPAVTVLVNWGVASALLIGSRLFFRVFHERWSAANETLLTDIPMARVILVGAGFGAKAFLKNLKRQKTELYDVLGYVESDPTLDATLEGVDVLGSLADLPDLIENFNAEGLHPHHIIFTDTHYLGSKARALLANLSSFNVSFMKVDEDSQNVQPLSVEDVFYKEMDDVSTDAFAGKNIMIYGAACPLAQNVMATLENSQCAKIVLWDQNTSALSALKRKASFERVHCFAKASCDEAQLAAYFKEQQIDVFLNLKAFAALETESYDTALSFEVYVEENERFAQACEKAGVGHYYFITQEAPHGALAAQLSPVAGELLKGHTKVSKATFASIKLPYVLSSRDPVFQGQKTYSVSQKEISVVSPEYGAHMLMGIMSAVLTKTPWSAGDDLQMETVSYDDLAEIYSRLNHGAPKPTYTLKAVAHTNIIWDEEHYKNVQKSLKNMDYNGAVETLERLYA